MYDLKNIRPARFGSKLRLGKDSDGGYVLLREQIEATETLLSFGVATDWSFEEDFFRRRSGLKVLMLDASTSFPSILARLAAKLVKFDFTKARHYLFATVHYVTFIALNPSVSFHGKFLAVRGGPREVTFEDVLRWSGDGLPRPGSVFVKLDIEGGEYDLLPVIARHAGLINGIAIEFHDLDRMGKRMEEVMRLLSEQFVVAHVHGNNYTGLVPGTPLPLSLEVTLVNRSLAGADQQPDTDAFPHPVLDFPNDPAKEDYQLIFS